MPFNLPVIPQETLEAILQRRQANIENAGADQALPPAEIPEGMTFSTIWEWIDYYMQSHGMQKTDMAAEATDDGNVAQGVLTEDAGQDETVADTVETETTDDIVSDSPPGTELEDPLGTDEIAEEELHSQAMQQLTTFLYLVSTTLNNLQISIRELVAPADQTFATANEAIEIEAVGWQDYQLLSVTAGNQVAPLLLTSLLLLKTTAAAGNTLDRANSWGYSNALIGWKDEDTLILGAENAGTETFSIYGIRLFDSEDTLEAQPGTIDLPTVPPSGIGPPIEELPDLITVGATYFPWTWGLPYNHRSSSAAAVTQPGRWIAFTGNRVPLVSITPVSLFALATGSDEELRVLLSYNGASLVLDGGSGQKAVIDGMHTLQSANFTSAALNLVFNGDLHTDFAAMNPSAYLFSEAGTVVQIEDTERTSMAGNTVSYDITGNNNAISVLNGLSSGDKLNLVIAARNSIRQDSLRLDYGLNHLSAGDDEVARSLFNGASPVAGGDATVNAADITSIAYDATTHNLTIQTSDDTEFTRYFDDEGPSLFIVKNTGELSQIPDQWRTGTAWAVPGTHPVVRADLSSLSQYLLVIAAPDSVGYRSAWERVTGLGFNREDADTQSRKLFYEAGDFSEPNRVIGVYRLNMGDNMDDIVAFQTTAAVEQMGLWYYFPVMRFPSFDRQDNFDVHPPSDSNYTIRLLLPFIYQYITTRTPSSEDGFGYEAVYTRTQDETRPDRPMTTAGEDATDDFVPAGWTDEPAGVGIPFRFEWVSTRTGRQGNWEKFSPPALWARYSDDGLGVEFIYRRTKTLLNLATLVEGLPSGDRTFEVRAVNARGGGMPSNAITVTVP